MKWPEELDEFIASVEWVFAKTYAKRWPHEYIVRDRVYWTMVPPADDPGWYPAWQETVINRCPTESTYEYRLEHGLLP